MTMKTAVGDAPTEPVQLDWVKEQRAATFRRAALLWREMQLPAFEVDGFIDGRYVTWTVPEMLELLAQRVIES